MRVALNPSTGALELRDASATVWPVDFDAGSGRLQVRLDGLTISARPLLWREKRVLARYAAYGEKFLQRQLLAACCGPVAAAAAPETCQALAEWVNFPTTDSSSYLPFTPEALTRATAVLCRTTGWRPAELDALDALEVESLWRATAAEQPVTPSVAETNSERAVEAANVANPHVPSFAASSEMNTIRIVADPPPAAAADPDALISIPPVVMAPTAAASAEAPSAPAVAPASPIFSASNAAQSPDMTGHQAIRQRATRRSLAAHLRAVEPGTTTLSAATPSTAPQSDAPADSPATAPMTFAAGPEWNVVPAAGAARRSAAEAPAIAETAVSRRIAPLAAVALAPVDAFVTPTATIVDFAPGSSAPDALPDEPAVALVAAQSPRPVAATAVRPIAAAFDVDELIDTFSERLQQAAFESGVDVEAY